MLLSCHCVRQARPSPPVTPLGRLLSELLRLSDPGQTTYDASECCWRDAAGNTTLDLASFTAISRAIGPCGVGGLDTLLGMRAAEVSLYRIPCNTSPLAGPLQYLAFRESRGPRLLCCRAAQSRSPGCVVSIVPNRGLRGGGARGW